MPGLFFDKNSGGCNIADTVLCLLGGFCRPQTVEKVQPMLGFFHYLCYNNHG